MSSLVFWLSSASLLILSEYELLSAVSLSDSLAVLFLWLSLAAFLISYMMSSLVAVLVLWWTMVIILLAAFLVNKLFLFYLLFEFSLLPILIMLLFMGNQPERLSAGVYFVMYTMLLSLPFMVLVLLVLISQHFMTNKVISLGSLMTLLVMAPFLAKMPVLGVHFWLPKAHVEANTSGSMILAGLLLKLGSYGIVRILTIFVVAMTMLWSASFWLILAVISSLITMFQSDLKKFVAYSSVAHMTFMMVGLVSQSKLVFISAIIMSLAHGWASMSMFGFVGASSHSVQSRLGALSSPEVALSWSVVIFGVSLLVNASVPPFPSFFPEAIMAFFLKSTWLLGSLIFVLLSLFVCYYNSFLFFVLAHKKGLSSSSIVFFVLEGAWISYLALLSMVTVLCLRIHFKSKFGLLLRFVML